jgi:glutamate racemase
MGRTIACVTHLCYFRTMESAAELPIGVFDSGLGGLTVLRALRERMPRENFVYLGDVARLPYGSKSQSVVREYARQCIDFLLARKVKAIVIACNTASAMALDALRDQVPVPLFGVVKPGVRAGLAAGEGGILVLGTESTVRSEAYLKEFALHDRVEQVSQLACPLLVPLAEEGWFDHSVTRQVIAHYLQAVDWSTIRTVVLGCTHFPLLEPSLRQVLPDGVRLVHGGTAVAEEVAEHLTTEGLFNPRGQGAVQLLTTDRVSNRFALLGEWSQSIGEAQVVHLGLISETP